MTAKKTDAQLRADACKTVWETLSKINVNEHTEKKNNLTYLSWAWAYQTVMNTYPTFDYAFAPTEYLPDGTAMVYCSVWVWENGVKVEKPMWLPVMNYKNQAIIQPNAVDVNNAKMRCLAKAISMLGLGAYIYAGEDLPQDGDTSGAPPEARKAAKDNATKKPPAKSGHAKKKAPAKKAAAKKAAPKQDDDDMSQEPFAEFENEEGAKEVADLLIQFASNKKTSSNLRSLAGFWKKNSAVLDKLDEEYPEQFERVKAKFTELRKNIQQEK